MVAALIADHEHHALARPHLRAAHAITAIVLAETFSQLRRTFGQPAGVAAALVQPWTADPDRVLPTSAAVIGSTFARAAELDLGGSIHDVLIAGICLEHGASLITLDGRQHRLALALGVRSTFLLS
jgi:predicted nucleic acid-binding protein